jgi:hypothetical protein
MSRRLIMVRVGTRWLVPVCRIVAEEELPMFTGSVWQRALALLREYLRTRLVRGEITPAEECVFHGSNFQITLSARSSEAAPYSVLSRTAGRAAANGPYQQRQSVLPQTVFMHIEPWVPHAASVAPGQPAPPQQPARSVQQPAHPAPQQQPAAQQVMDLAQSP